MQFLILKRLKMSLIVFTLQVVCDTVLKGATQGSVSPTGYLTGTCTLSLDLAPYATRTVVSWSRPTRRGTVSPTTSSVVKCCVAYCQIPRFQVWILIRMPNQLCLAESQVVSGGASCGLKVLPKLYNLFKVWYSHSLLCFNDKLIVSVLEENIYFP